MGETFYNKLQLQGRRNASEPWGIYNTVPVDNLDDKGVKKAKAEIERQRNNWLGNYDPTIEFRVVKL